MDTLEIQSSPHSKSCMIRAGTACTVYVFFRTVQCRVDLERSMQQMQPGKIIVRGYIRDTEDILEIQRIY